MPGFRLDVDEIAVGIILDDDLAVISASQIDERAGWKFPVGNCILRLLSRLEIEPVFLSLPLAGST
jgi:hypothetical protein